jgi:hypothetical protein
MNRLPPPFYVTPVNGADRADRGMSMGTHRLEATLQPPAARS